MGLFYNESDSNLKVSLHLAKCKLLFPQLAKQIALYDKRQRRKRLKQLFTSCLFVLLYPYHASARDAFPPLNPALARKYPNWKELWSTSHFRKLILLFISFIVSLAMLIAAASYRSAYISTQLKATRTIDLLQKENIVLKSKADKVKVLQKNFDQLVLKQNHTSLLFDSCMESLNLTLPVVQASADMDLILIRQENEIKLLTQDLNNCQMKLVKKESFHNQENRVTPEFQKTLKTKKSGSKLKQKSSLTKTVTKKNNVTNNP